MKRVVLCVQNLSVPRDPRVWRQAKTLRDAGYAVAVIAPRDPRQPGRETLEGIDVLRFAIAGRRGGASGYIAETLSALGWTAALSLRLRAGGRIDVLHAANPPDTFFLVGLLLRPFGTRYIFDQHDLSPELGESKWGSRCAMQWALRRLERFSFRAADLVIANNGSYLDVAVERGGVDRDRVVVVRNGVDSLRQLAPRLPVDGPITVAFAGAMGSQDGIEVLIDAIARVHRARPGAIRLDMIGDGDHVEGLRTCARGHGVDEIVDWAGWLSGGAFMERLSRACVAVSPDLDDEFSRTSTMMKVADYLVCGLPCVIADLTENRVTAGDAALYFKPGDAADLTARLLQLVDEPQLRYSLSQRAVERARGLLWELSAARMLAAYRHLLDGGPAVEPEQRIGPVEAAELAS